MVLAGCSGTAVAIMDTTDTVPTNEAHVITGTTAQVTELSGAADGVFSAADLFTECELTQNADLDGAV